MKCVAGNIFSMFCLAKKFHLYVMTVWLCKCQGRRDIYASWELETILRRAQFIAMKKRFGKNNKERGRKMQYQAKERALYQEVAVKIRKIIFPLIQRCREVKSQHNTTLCVFSCNQGSSRCLGVQVQLVMVEIHVVAFRVNTENTCLCLFLFFIVASYILIYVEFTHQQMDFFIFKKHIKIYIKIHINVAPTFFGLRPSSGSLH